MIRVILPYHLRTLAQVGAEVQLDVTGPVTPRAILDALEARYPMLCGTIRDHVTKERRPLLRFWAWRWDESLTQGGASLCPGLVCLAPSGRLARISFTRPQSLLIIRIRQLNVQFRLHAAVVEAAVGLFVRRRWLIVRRWDEAWF